MWLARDEAHRSQNGFGDKMHEKTGELSYGFSSNRRDASALDTRLSALACLIRFTLSGRLGRGFSRGGGGR